MKKKMCRWIFKKELNEAYTELNNSYCREVRRVEAAMEHNEKKYGLMKRIFSLLPTAEIIGLEENGNKEELIVVLHDNSILLFRERYQGICGLPRIYFEVNTQEIDGLERKYVHIIDILMEDNNIGNGTVAMKDLLKYAKKINAKWIDGGLSSVDNDHADRRNHFYEKFGFEITENEEQNSNFYGKITLNL